MKHGCLPLIVATFFLVFGNAYAEQKAEGIFKAIVKVRALSGSLVSFTKKVKIIPANIPKIIEARIW